MKPVDPISQATIGAAAAQVVARPARFVGASVVGAVGGVLPDLDVLIRSPTDPLLALEYHRHFTHALAFVPIGGAIAAFCCAKLSRGRAGFRELYLPATLGWATHGLLDSCTSYGTYLYWPFSSERVAWHVISIIDPIFTLPLLFGVLWAYRKRSARIARGFLLASLAYIGFAVFQLQRAEAVYAEVIAERGHSATGMQVKPSLGNGILYRAFYEHDGHYYADAVRVNWLGQSQIYPGSHHPVLDVDGYIATHDLDALRQADIERFSYFSAGYLVEDPRYEGVISDFRYAAIPNDIAPMWGIDVLGTPAGEHPAWQHFRDFPAEDRATFFAMLWGR